MRIHPTYIQLAGDALIPLLGFFFWDWSLYFILLFYGIDLLTREVLIHIKSKKINNYLQENGTHSINTSKSSRVQALLSALLLIVVTLLVQTSMPFVQENFSWKKEIVDFWTYKEMGIQQGYILLPLIVFMGYSQYKMEFMMPALYKKVPLELLWKKHLQGLLILLAFAGLAAGLVRTTELSPSFLVLAIVFFSVAYQLLLGKKVN